MDDDGVELLFGAFMEAEPEARPILRRFFFAHAARDWAAGVPEDVLVRAAMAMNAMRDACERRDYAEALAQLKVWAALLGITEGGGQE